MVMTKFINVFSLLVRMSVKDLEKLTKDLPIEDVNLAEKAAMKILLESYKLEGNPTIKILTNNDYEEKNFSPLSLILSQGYANAARMLGFNNEVLLTPSKKQTEPVSLEELQFIQDTKENDLVLFVVNNKPGSYSKTLGENKTASKILIENKARYGQHFRLGEIGLENNDHIETYIKALSMDYAEAQSLGNKINDLLMETSQVKIISGDGSSLVYEGDFKEPLVYCGDFDGTKNNYGGNLPSGETFTELIDLEGVNGEALIRAYGGEKGVTIHNNPERITIAKGKLTDSSDKELIKLLEKYMDGNEQEFMQFFEEGYPIRELGFGVNYEIGRQNIILPNVIWIEKMPGFHTSIGISHIHYHDKAIDGLAKELNKKPKGHTDLMFDTKQIYFDGKKVFENGKYLI